MFHFNSLLSFYVVIAMAIILLVDRSSQKNQLVSRTESLTSTKIASSEDPEVLPRRHCQDYWNYHGNKSSGMYQIDPDNEGPLGPFWIYCEMPNGAETNKVITVLHHDCEDVKDIRGAEAPGSYIRNVSYNATPEDSLYALVDSATNCEQYIKWECKGAMFGFWYLPQVNSWWVGRNWKPQYYWGGAATDSHSCGCHPYCKATERNSTCNCDANDKLAWLEDEGLLLDKTRLPVLQLRFGDTGQTNEAGKHTLGPLKCIHSSHNDIIMGSYIAPISFTSPGFRDNKYPPPFRIYHWTVAINYGDIIEMVFPTYNIVHWGSYTSIPECEYVIKASIKRDSDVNSTIIRAQKTFPPYFISEGEKTVVNLTMTTCNQMENNIEENGFEVVFRKAECRGCEASINPRIGITVCSGECGTIASHRYPYPHQTYEAHGFFNQSWLIAVHKTLVVKLSFNDFDLPIMPGNKKCNPKIGVVKIYSGESILSSKKIGEYCNLNRQGVVYSKGREMLIVYTGNHFKVGNGRGFHAIFKAISKKDVPPPGMPKDLKNVAKGKPAKQSSTAEIYGAHLAVDGIYNGGSCVATNFEKEPWWRVDLQEQYLVYKVKIYAKDSKSQTLTIREESTVVWPSGKYGLPKPSSGCPTEFGTENMTAIWESGMVFQEMVYPIVQDEKVLHWAEGTMLKGGVKDDGGVEQHFCMKVNDSSSDFEWMPGHYCIYRYGPHCPRGFESGSIKWINNKGHNNNYSNGTLPAGFYNSSYTKIYFCCRDDGDYNDPIRLPIDMPFYLLQYGEDCQRVESMNNLRHYFHFMEDESHISLTSSRFKHPHPKIDAVIFEKGFTLYYCYYDIINSLRGFRVVVDNHGLTSTWTQFYDNRYFGMPHAVDDKFGGSYTCVHYAITNPEVIVLDKNCEQPIVGQYITMYIYKRYDSLQICEIEVYGKEMCGQPLGMSSEEIKDSQLTASSSDTELDHHYTNARLNHRFGWCANNDNEKQYLQVDLGSPTIVSGVVLQGLNQATTLVFVWNFTLEFSNDTINWVYEEEPYGRKKIYQCIQCHSKRYKNDVPVTYNFLRHFGARYVRLYIIGYEEAPCMRMELYGCRSRDVCAHELTEPNGVIQSPNYPFYYGQDLSCWWTITPPSGKNVELDFIVFELAKPEPAHRAGSCRDFLTVNLGSSLEPIKSSNGKSFPKSLISNGNMTITLRSCFRSTISRDRGFFARYSFTDCPGCGVGDYTCTDKYPCSSTCGYIKSINHPLNYENNHRCRWLIEVPERHYISITFEDFDVIGSENCQEDFVDFYDGNGTTKEYLIGRYCNSNMPTSVIYSSWNTLTVEFSSTAKTTARGFLLKYTAQTYQLPRNLKGLVFLDANHCGNDGWKHFNYNCYKLFAERTALQWGEAESSCNKQGGLTDKQHDGNFRWQDKNPMSYSDWSKPIAQDNYPQPNGGPYEGCTVIWLESIHATNNWHDVPCSLDSQHGVKLYMCKKPSKDSGIAKKRQQLHLRVNDISAKSKLKEHRYFFCKSLEVISVIYVCDGFPDCRDGSDELSCATLHKSYSFECTNKRKISISKYCDYEMDCSDGSDEDKCVRRKCLHNETQCRNEQCIPQGLLCDLKADCKDNSDEYECNGNCNPNKTFQCYDGKCNPLHTHCDGFFDCPGSYHEDEIKNCNVFPERRRVTGRETKYRRSCYELYMLDNITQTRYYKIDPDLDGPLLPFLVQCVVGSGARSVKTVVHHDSEDRIYTHGEIEMQGTYHRDIIYYYGTLEQLKKLTNISESCRQYVKWECSGSHHYANKTPITWWEGQSPQYCCSVTKDGVTCNCYSPTCNVGFSQCNCDGSNSNVGDFSNKTDDNTGYIQDIDHLPIMQVKFGSSFETGRAGYHSIGPLECFGGEVNENRISKKCEHCDTIICNNGHIVKNTVKCIYDIDEYGYIIGCRDVTHLRNCVDFICPAHHYKCPGSYCIPFRFLCNGVYDCPEGYDEQNCKNFTCPGYYRCRKNSYCIPLHQLCDGKRQCEFKDDEVLCDIECPTQCHCKGLYVVCNRHNLTAFPVMLSPETRKLDLSHNHLTQNTLDVRQTTELAELILSHNHLSVLSRHLFYGLQHLYLLDISYNLLVRIESKAFDGLANLIRLNLEGNSHLAVLDPNAFMGLTMLPELSITHTKLTRLQKNTFFGLESLEILNLTNNLIYTVEDGAFISLENVEILDIRKNKIKRFFKQMFGELKKLAKLYSDAFRFCCLAHPQVPFENCSPPADEFSSCKDLMSNSILRMFLWFLGIVAFIGNLTVICWRSKTKEVSKVSSILILSLGFADFIMGVYLLIIASVDVYYRGNYIAYSDHWQESLLCRIAGFLSTLSSEVSVFTLTFITLDRLICIVFPLSIRRLSLRAAYILISASWTVAGLIAAMPFFVESYFKNEFYARSGVCLALHITNQKPAGWEYSVAIFFCANFVAFLIIIVSYMYMYVVIKRASRYVNRNQTKKSNEAKIGRQMALVVLTNFCCWMPIIIMGLCAMLGSAISGEVYAWTAVFILPLNSATNPIIYTLSSVQFKTMLKRKRGHALRRSLSASLQPGTVVHRAKTGGYSWTYRPPKGYTSLQHFLRTRYPLHVTDVLDIARGLCQALDELHSNGYALGGFEMDYIFVYKTDSGAVNVYLPDINAYQTYAPINDVHTEDTAKDIEDFGKIVKKMLQIYHVTGKQNTFARVSTC